jgi:hypothetical protein
MCKSYVGRGRSSVANNSAAHDISRRNARVYAQRDERVGDVVAFVGKIFNGSSGVEKLLGFA